MTLRTLLFAISVVQLFDVAIHALTGQLEPLRIAASVAVLAAAVLAGAGRSIQRSVGIAAAGLGAYLVLNALFLVREGVTNPAQGGAFRTMLFVLVLATTLLMLAILRHRAARAR